MLTGPQLEVSSDRLVKPGIKPETPGLQGAWFIQYTTAALCLSFFVMHYFVTILVLQSS